MKGFLAIAAAGLLLTGCLGGSAPITTAAHVDLERFMGRWYVIANIPTPFERDAYNAVEQYMLGEDGRVHTTFTYRDGGFDAPVETMTPIGYVRDDSGNAVWAMQFIWPFKAEYRVLYIDDSYELTVIGRSKRDYAWIMARSPTIEESDLDRMIGHLRATGYDTAKVRLVPQRWPADSAQEGAAAITGGKRNES